MGVDLLCLNLGNVMNNIAFLKEDMALENRCSILPNNVKFYTRLGAIVYIEKGIGLGINIPDTDYIDAGAHVVDDKQKLLEIANTVISIHKISIDYLAYLSNKLIISFLDPFNNLDFVNAMLKNNVSSISMEMIPRITRCQKMDALSSQASLAGYVMVTKAIAKFNRILPMMMTAAGTIKPAKVFVIGAGVAGLQAIATAKRLGASVVSYDTRSEVAEQVKSLGAKFLDIDLGETGSTEQGYAKALTTEQILLQQQAQEQCILESDIVITTAQLFGRTPPKIITLDTLSKMKAGAVVVDMAAENGGNVEGSLPNEIVDIGNVTVIGTGNWANDVPMDAAQMYANNVYNLVSEFWGKDEQQFMIDPDDEVLNTSLVSHSGNLVSPSIANYYSTNFQESEK